MGSESVLSVALRLVGIAYVVGGVAVVRQARMQLALGSALNDLEAALSGGERLPDDPGRARWLIVGGVLTVVAGAVLAVVPSSGVWPQGLLVVHQFAYFARQHSRMRRAEGEAEREDAAPSSSGVNAAIGALLVWVAAAWLARG